MNNPVEVFVDLPDGRRLRAVTGGAGEPVFLLVHGADRNFQNASHWRTHHQALAARGRFIAVDLLGHGGSRPGANDPLPAAVAPARQVQALVATLEQIAPGAAVIAIGRSYGGRIVCDLAAARPDLVRAFVLIAPSLPVDALRALPTAVVSKPALLVWAQDDPVVPYANNSAWRQTFGNLRMFDAGTINPPANERWRAHMPENEHPAIVQRAVAEFVNGIA